MVILWDISQVLALNFRGSRVQPIPCFSALFQTCFKHFRVFDMFKIYRFWKTWLFWHIYQMCENIPASCVHTQAHQHDFGVLSSTFSSTGVLRLWLRVRIWGQRASPQSAGEASHFYSDRQQWVDSHVHAHPLLSNCQAEECQWLKSPWGCRRTGLCADRADPRSPAHSRSSPPPNQKSSVSASAFRQLYNNVHSSNLNIYIYTYM